MSDYRDPAAVVLGVLGLLYSGLIVLLLETEFELTSWRGIVLMVTFGCIVFGMGLAIRKALRR